MDNEGNRKFMFHEYFFSKIRISQLFGMVSAGTTPLVALID